MRIINFIEVVKFFQMADSLGLTVLDEPAIQQSDPTILGMQLRNEMKGDAGPAADAPVKKLDRADKNTEEIERWITSIKVGCCRIPLYPRHHFDYL